MERLEEVKFDMNLIKLLSIKLLGAESRKEQINDPAS